MGKPTEERADIAPRASAGAEIAPTTNRSERRIRPAGRALSAGNSRPQSSAIADRRRPAATTAGTAPIAAASTPDSNSPSSFEAPMNTVFTAETRPRMASGVSPCTKVWRT